VVGDGTASKAIAAAVAARQGRIFPAFLKPVPASVAALAGRHLLAFAGIGDPARFFATLRGCALDVVGERSFADHHRFSQSEITALLDEARREGLTLVTTEKDFARLGPGVGTFLREVVPFKVTLEFQAVEDLKKFLAERLFRARQKARHG
jgi:tetraacyldisaccharide 4'-kinase